MAASASVALYTAFYAGEAKLGASILYAIVGALVAVWMLAFGVMLQTMEPKYRHTFVSTQSGRDYVMGIFRDNAGNEELRAQIFVFNEELWRPIRLQVLAWARSRFHAWKQERPAWFTEALCSHIPTDFIPVRDARRLSKLAPGGQRTTLHDASLAQRLSLSLGVHAPPAVPLHQVVPTGEADASESHGSDSDESESTAPADARGTAEAAESDAETQPPHSAGPEGASAL